MSLFPKCKFSVHLTNGVIRAGEKAEGELIIQVPEPIPRADHLDLFFRTTAVAGYGSGKTRSVAVRNMLSLPMQVTFPKDVPLAAGTHRWPFSLDIPAWLPPNYSGSDCSIASAIDLRLDVDWAIDPKVTLSPVVVLPPVSSRGAPLTSRSPAGFHDSLVFEVTLDSKEFAQDQPLRGNIALRGGQDARFDAVVLSVLGIATISMTRSDRRNGAGVSIRIPKGSLIHGEAVPFEFPPNLGVLPEFTNGFIDHHVVLRVTADIPWATDPAFDLPLHLLPAGSQVFHEGTSAPVGATRLRELASAMSVATGLPVGRVPTLVEGAVGPATVRIADGTRSGQVGIDIDLTFPDLGLGATFRPVGLLDAFHESPLLPPAIGTKYLFRRDAKVAPGLADDTLKGFLNLVFASLEPADGIRFSDHHLGFHLIVTDDGSANMAELAQFAAGRAKAIVDAIAAFPFPASVEGAAPAWRATAAEQNAFFLPHVPAIHGIAFNARILGGEGRGMRATMHTVWRANAPVIVVDLDLRAAPLAQATGAELEKETGFAAVRAVFPVIHATTPEKVTLETAAFVADPRTLLPALEQFFDLVLEGRGERRTDSPYR